MMEMVKSIFYLNGNIKNKNKQIIFEGNGIYNTTLNHSPLVNNNTLSSINCYFRQCHITLINLKYISSNNINKINVSNGEF